MKLTRTIATLSMLTLTVITTLARAEGDYPQGCLCKDAFKKVTLEITDPVQPHLKRKAEQIKQVKGLLHCNCGKQECVIAAPIERTEIHMSCTDR